MLTLDYHLVFIHSRVTIFSVYPENSEFSEEDLSSRFFGMTSIFIELTARSGDPAGSFFRTDIN